MPVPRVERPERIGKSMEQGEDHGGPVSRNDDELRIMRELASSGDDNAVLMVNVNRYRADSGFPDRAPYVDYMACLADLVLSVGGRIDRRFPVSGQPVGRQPQAHEILAIWYPSHRTYLDLPDQPGAERNYELRRRCVQEAVIHRCPGSAWS